MREIAGHLDLAFVAASLCEVVGDLHPQQMIHPGSESPFDAQRHFLASTYLLNYHK